MASCDSQRFLPSASPAVTQAGPNLVSAFASAIRAHPYGILGWEKDAVMPARIQSLKAASPAFPAGELRENTGITPSLLKQRCFPREDA